MLDPRLFKLSGVRAGAAGIVALFFVLLGRFYISAQYLQDVKGSSPLLTGACILPLAIAMPYTSARSTRVAARIGARATIVVGLLSVAAAIARWCRSRRRQPLRAPRTVARARRRRHGSGDAPALGDDRPGAAAQPRGRQLGPHQHDA
ncbi:MAG TPA: hypothetical protein VHX88_01210 [Solirubrobacteraceae bacterium]|jgi:hypothetical protein|nr:hypothetical protein [Solirubrobacteraceae bacterium]